MKPYKPTAKKQKGKTENSSSRKTTWGIKSVRTNVVDAAVEKSEAEYLNKQTTIKLTL